MFWNFFIWLVGLAIQLVLAPKPQNAKPAALEDFNIPRADEGAEIPVVFGTPWLNAPRAVWYGDPVFTPRRSGRRYGFFGPRTTIGYWYHLGIHMVLCHAVADKLVEVRAGDKELWTGSTTGGQITVSKKELFGGNNGEGGISGSFDVEMGRPDQDQNDYMVEVHGADVPAFRGVVSVILRGMYLGTTPYIKPWAFLLQRIYLTSAGVDQWYPETAAIGDIPETTSGEVVLTWWQNNGIDTDRGQLGLRFYDANGNDLSGVTTYSGWDAPSVWTERSLTLTAPEGTGIIRVWMWLQRLDGSGNNAVIDDVSVTVNGEAKTLSNPGAEEGTGGWYTTIGGLFSESADPPGPHGGAKYFKGSFFQTIAFQDIIIGEGAVFDMNPAHMIREALTDASWGMGYTADDIDDTSFTAAADTLYAEGFGLSMVWSREETIEEFIRIILSHIDAYLYVSRSTGKFVLKLVRNDYTVGALQVIDDDDVVSWGEFVRRQTSEAVTSVTVKYYQRSAKKEAARVVHNIAAIQQAGRVINATRQYPGIQRTPLAARVALRDLRSLGAGLASGRIVCKRTADALNPGDPFVLQSDRYGVEIVARVVDMKFGDGRSNTVTITFAEDVFHLGDDLVVQVDDDEPESPWPDPAAVTQRVVQEMPYYELVQALGSDATALLTEDPDGGMFQAAGASPVAGALYAVMSVDDGGGYEDVPEPMDFSPACVLDGAVTALATTLTIEANTDLDIMDVEPGDLAVIGSEIVRVDSWTSTSLTVGRGCLDTIPAAHADGAAVVFLTFAASDLAAYTDGNSVNVKLKTVTGAGELAAPPADTVTFDSRAIRPLRPADCQINGDGVGPVNAIGLDVDCTWVVRNRTLVASVLDWEDGGQTAESGQTTVLEVYDDESDVLLATHSAVTSPYTIPSGDYASSSLIRVKFLSERDGYRSWTGYEIVAQVAATSHLVLETNDNLLLESGDRFLLE